MKVLVTGGAGYIGSCVSQFLIDKGIEVIIVDNLKRGLKKNIPKKSRFYKCNIQDKIKINKILKNNKIDVVIHFAAYVNNEESILKPEKYIKNNYINGKIFFSSCINNNVTRMIYSSTAAIYGNNKKKVTEENLSKPISPYAKSKLLFEKYLEKNKKKISCIILRYFNVAGADKDLRCGFNTIKNNNLFLNLCHSVIKEHEFKINGKNHDTQDGTTIRDFIHVRDLAEIHYKILKLLVKKNIFQKLNCGYGFGVSVLQILKEFIKVSKKKINYRFIKKRKGDIVYSVADPSKLKKFIKWKPKNHSLNQLVKSSLNWYKKMSH